MSLQGRTLPGPDTADDENEPLAREDVFDVLSNERRRCVLDYLKRHEEQRVELRELVDHVAAWENDSKPREVDSDARKRVYTALRQSHLPKLDKTGIVNYEHQRGEVELTDQAREVQLYLEHVPKNDIPWSEYYLGLSAVCAGLVTVTWLEIYPFVELTGIGLAAIMVMLFAISSAVHTYDASRSKLGSDSYEVTEE